MKSRDMEVVQQNEAVVSSRQWLWADVTHPAVRQRQLAQKLGNHRHDEFTCRETRRTVRASL